MNELHQTEIELLLAFHDQKAEWHLERARALRADQGGQAQPAPSIIREPDPDQDKIDRLMVLAAIQNPAPGNEGRTMRGIQDYIVQTRGERIAEPAVERAIQILIAEGRIETSNGTEGFWIREDRSPDPNPAQAQPEQDQPAMKNGKPTNNHPWRKEATARAQAKAAKTGSKRGGHRSEGKLRTPNGVPVTRTKAIVMILYKAETAMTTREIADELHAAFKDEATTTTVSAACIGLRKRDILTTEPDGKWQLLRAVAPKE